MKQKLQRCILFSMMKVMMMRLNLQLRRNTAQPILRTRNICTGEGRIFFHQKQSCKPALGTHPSLNKINR